MGQEMRTIRELARALRSALDLGNLTYEAMTSDEDTSAINDQISDVAAFGRLALHEAEKRHGPLGDAP